MSAVLKPGLGLRPMIDADLPAVMAIENTIYAFPWTPGNFRDSLAAGYSCWIGERDLETIGYVVLMLATDQAHLLNLSIASAWQGQGHGSALLQSACVAARELGAQLMFLEVRPSNAAGIRLYERHGFTQVGRRREYYPAHAGREDALIYSLPL